MIATNHRLKTLAKGLPLETVMEACDLYYLDGAPANTINSVVSRAIALGRKAGEGDIQYFKLHNIYNFYFVGDAITVESRLR